MAYPRILIVANGPSLEGVDLEWLPPRVFIIAVNGAIDVVPRADAFFSLDPSVYVRSLVRRRPLPCDYYLAVPDDYGTRRARVIAHRDPPDTGVRYLRRVSGDGVRGAHHGLSEDTESIHTGNSAYGALGLAYHMRPRKVVLIGVDGTCDPYAYRTDAPRLDFDHVPDLFASAVPQLEARGVQVRNGSPASCVTCFPRVEPSAALRWLVR